MRFIFTVFLTALFAVAPAVAQVRDVTPGSITPGFFSTTNYIKNPSCLANKNDITDSSSIVTRITSGGLVDGKSCQIDATAGSQLVKFTMKTFDNSTKGQNCEARFIYTGDASLYQAYVEEGGSSTQVSGTVTLTNAGSNSRTASLAFPCGDPADAKRLVIASTGNGATIQTALGYGGLVTNVGDANVDTEIVSYSPTFNSTTGHSASNGWWYRKGDKYVIGGSVLWNGAGAGTTFTVSTPSSCTIDLAKLNDPSSIGSIRNRIGAWSWYDDSGGLSINPQWARANSTTSILLMDGSNTVISNIFANNDRISWQVEVPCVGLAATNFVTPASQGWWAGANIGAVSSVDLGVTTAAKNEITRSDMTLTAQSGSAPIGIACADGTTSVIGGTTCSSNEALGVITNIPVSGQYDVCFNGSNYIEDASSSTNMTVLNVFQIDYTSAASKTAITAGARSAPSYLKTNSGTGVETVAAIWPFMLCETFTLPAGAATFRIKNAVTATGTVGFNNLQPNAGMLGFSIRSVTSAVPSPILVGSATSPDAISKSRAEIINTIKAVAADYTALFSDETIEVDSSAAARTITLPTLASAKGKKFEIVPTSDTNRVIIDGNGSETICGQTTISLFGTHDKVTLQAGTSGWMLADGQCIRTVSAVFAGASRTSSCTSTPCVLYQNKGNWVSSVTRSAGGKYDINVATGVFATGSEPECVFTTATSTMRVAYLDTTPTPTLIDISTQNLSGSDTDAAMSFKCSGPR